MQRFPDARLPWIDLSTGINPRPFPIAALTGADHRALPSRSALTQLEEAAARAFGMAAGAIAALPGSEIGLRLLATIGLPEPMHVATPCYRTHLDAFPGATRIDIDGLPCLRGTTDSVLLANPNNPDGRLVAPERLLEWVRGTASREGWLVTDEAFADAAEGTSVLPLVEDEDRVLVLRSFGKFYGLAGIRLGFVCGHPDMVERVRQRLGDWPVSTAAIAVGTAAYADDGWAAAARLDIEGRAFRLDTLLDRHGYRATGSCPLFRLVESADAPALFDRLGRAAILTRPFDEAPTWLRIGLPGNDEAFDRLNRTLGDR